MVKHTLLPLRGLLGHLLSPRNRRLGPDATKDEPNAEPLHAREAVAEGHDGQHHGGHFAGDGHGDEEDGGEGCEGVDFCVWISCQL